MTSQRDHTKPASAETLAAEYAGMRSCVDVARRWLWEPLAMQITRPGSHLAMHVDGLHDELHGILDTLTGPGGDQQ
ncbi:MAG TPA: hypothetical protein VK891_16900 [Euzebyales bacterium]|nr:hypothetical protein [Euzebyales bacterium]